MGLTGLAFLDNSITALNISAVPWISSVYILALFIVIAIIFTFITKKFVGKLTARTKTDLDDKLVKKAKGPVFNIIILIGLLLAINPFALENKFITTYNGIIFTLLIFFVAKLLIAVFDLILIRWAAEFAKRTKSNIDKDVLPLMLKTVNVVVYILAVLMILGRWNIDIAPLLTSAGIAGLAFGFAIQDSLKNIFGGISLILDRAYKVGDMVELGDGTTGRIHDIGLRSTKITNWDGNLVIIPNGTLSNTTVTNIMGPHRVIKTKIIIGVSYNSDVVKVKKVITALLKKNKKVMFKEKPPTVRLNEFADSSLNFIIMYWTSLDDRWAAFEAVNNDLLSEFRKNKIEIPFPQQDIYVKQLKRTK